MPPPPPHTPKFSVRKGIARTNESDDHVRSIAIFEHHILLPPIELSRFMSCAKNVELSFFFFVYFVGILENRGIIGGVLHVVHRWVLLVGG